MKMRPDDMSDSAFWKNAQRKAGANFKVIAYFLAIIAAGIFAWDNFGDRLDRLEMKVEILERMMK